MKESYVEGLATHDGPESCASVRKCRREALTGVRAGRVLSRENHSPKCRRYRSRRKAISIASVSRDALGLRAVRDPEHVRKHLAREPGDPVSSRYGWRCGTHREVQGPTPMMDGGRKSDSSVLPAKLPNNEAESRLRDYGIPQTGTKMETSETAKGAPTVRRSGAA